MTLDEIRFEIVSRHLDWSNKARCAQKLVELVEAELEAHDRAVAAMPVLNGAAKPERAKRRNIAALVREALTEEPQTVAQIAGKAGVPPSRVLPALQKLTQEGAWETAGHRWTRIAP